MVLNIKGMMYWDVELANSLFKAMHIPVGDTRSEITLQNMLLWYEHCQSFVYWLTFFWCMSIDESLSHACHKSLFLTCFQWSSFLFGFHLLLALLPTCHLHLLTPLNVDNFSFYTWEMFDYLSSVTLLCLLHLIWDPLFPYSKDSNYTGMGGSGVFS